MADRPANWGKKRFSPLAKGSKRGFFNVIGSIG